MNPISFWKIRPRRPALLVLVGAGFALYYQPLLGSYVFAGVYFSAQYGLNLEPDDRAVLRAFQRKFKRWRS